MTNQKNGTLYTGVTAYLSHRVYQHKNSLIEGFARKYHCIHLVYYEFFVTMDEAIAREKFLKRGTRQKKIDLIERLNPLWDDLYGSILV